MQVWILLKMHSCLGRRQVQACRPVLSVVVLVLKTEDSKCQVYTLGEVGLSQLPCAEWPVARVASYGDLVGLDVQHGGWGIW